MPYTEFLIATTLGQDAISELQKKYGCSAEEIHKMCEISFEVFYDERTFSATIYRQG